MTSTPSSEDSEEQYDALTEELHNIQSVIHVTRENIDALNARFANLQEPPPMYIAEYQELTSKLHELETKESELIEQLNAQQELEEKEQQQRELNEFQSHYQNQLQIQQQLLTRPPAFNEMVSKWMNDLTLKCVLNLPDFRPIVLFLPNTVVASVAR